MASIFTRILTRELPGFIVWEDDDFAAILDIHPINPGHTLLIPKLDLGNVYDLPSALYSRLWETVRILEPALKQIAEAKAIGILVQGLEVKHAHVHLVPLHTPDDLGRNDPPRASDADLAAMALRLRRAWLPLARRAS